MNAAIPRPPRVSRSAQLRQMLVGPELEFLMEAHNGLSARIVREAGFRGIWASGLSISAQFGVRDNNEASWTQVVDMLEFMADASDLPILLDGDTGYGNFNNLRRLVRKLEQRGIGGVCIEDKIFPKTNSFLNGERQPLADVDEFAGKIAAGKDTQIDPDFCIVARVEALIAGWGMEEALRRAEAYRRAGADAILIHSKLSRPDEILTFAREWGGRGPLVIVPTKYYSTPSDVFRKAGISTVIWANHLVRSSAAAMQAVARDIHDNQTVVNIEDRIVAVEEIFRLQDADEYSAAERLYLSAATAARAAIVLAAGRGRGLEAQTTDRPKIMLNIAGKPLLRWLIDGFKKQQINQITVVGGYRADAIETAGIRLVVNERHAQTGELASLACAIGELDADTVISYGDLLFRSYVLRALVESKGEFSVVVDSSAAGADNRTVRDFAYCSRADDRGLFGTPVRLERVVGGKDGALEGGAAPSAAHGLWIGLLNVSRGGVPRLKRVLEQLQGRADFDTLDMPALINALIADGAAIDVQYVHGHWRGVNDLEDLQSAVDLRMPRRLSVAFRMLPARLPMLEAREFVEAARARGFQWYAGVPCSYLTPFINYVLQAPDLRYVSMANEGDAVALAAGVTLAGDGRGGAGRGIAMMQNSGLGNAVSPLTSLTWTFGLPQLLIVTWRGQPGVPDEPQHALMGPITPTMLDTMQVAWELFPTEVSQLEAALERALAHMNATGRPYALLMQKGSVAPTELHAEPPGSVAQRPATQVSVRRVAEIPAQRPSRHEALTEIVAHTPEGETVLLASTGFCGRELYAIADRANHLYMVGSMGCVTPLALGLAVARPDLKVIALDGDGAALMRLGALATVGAMAPRNFWHLLLDNTAHESTGGQATVSATVAFADVAAACGYRSCLDTDSVTQLAPWLSLEGGPHFARLLTRTGTPKDLPRPKVTPVQVRERFMKHISASVRR